MTNGAAAGGGPVVRILPDADAAATAAAGLIADTLGEAIGERGRADWATTGGSAAVPMYRALARDPLRSAVAWAGVHLWWGDDRFVPYDHPQSNVLPAEQVLLGAGRAEVGLSGYRGDTGAEADEGVRLGPAQIHRWPTVEALKDGRDARWCAARYATDLRESGPAVNDAQVPVFDLIVLGVGGDGHILSVFPGSAVWDEPVLTAGVPAPTHVEPHVERVTLHPTLVSAARRVIVIAAGSSKVDALARAWSPGSEREIPARVAVRPGATWFVDEAAAAGIRR